MKNVNLFVGLLFALIMTTTVSAQDKKVLEVHYETNNVSEFLVSMLKSQIPDPEAYSDVLNKISQIKIYHTLYHNLETSESLFILDSIHEVKNMNTVGNVEYSYQNKEHLITGKENFMGKIISFEGDTDNLEWDITDEKKEIEGFSSTKAVLKNSPEIYVWFSTKIPVQAGPYFYTGLPGLVLETNGLFQSSEVTSVGYTDLNSYKIKYAEFQKFNDNDDKKVSLEELITKQENFQRMAKQGKK